jgi:hypothetical protein
MENSIHYKRHTLFFGQTILLLIVTILLMPFAVLAQQTAPGGPWIFAYFKNNGEDGLHLSYSRDTYHWTALHGDSSVLQPAAGYDKLMRDPCIIRGGNGKFHMVWTVSWGERSIGYASSDDLIHWSAQQTIPVMKDTSTLNAWAPEIFYDSSNQNYMIYWASTIPGKYPKLGVKADGKYNHRLYYVLTKDFKTFTPTKLLYDKGFSVIDATIQHKGNEYVMFLKNENDAPAEKNIRIATSKQLTSGYTNSSPPITGKYWAEGPTVLRTGNQWMVFFDKYTEHAYGAVESTDLKNWTDVSDKIIMPAGIRHGTILPVTEAELSRLLAAYSINP